VEVIGRCRAVSVIVKAYRKIATDELTSVPRVKDRPFGPDPGARRRASHNPFCGLPRIIGRGSVF
jgi:hypothetical protein